MGENSVNQIRSSRFIQAQNYDLDWFAGSKFEQNKYQTRHFAQPECHVNNQVNHVGFSKFYKSVGHAGTKEVHGQTVQRRHSCGVYDKHGAAHGGFEVIKI